MVVEGTRSATANMTSTQAADPTTNPEKDTSVRHQKQHQRQSSSQLSQFISRRRYRRGRPRPHSKDNNAARRSTSLLEKCAMLTLFIIAWAWIIVTVAVLTAYHPHSSQGTVTTNKAALPVSPEAVAHGVVAVPRIPKTDAHAPDPPLQPPPPVASAYLQPYQSPLLLITCRRPDYLLQTLNDVYQFRDPTCRIGCPIVISQDGHDAGVLRVVQEFQTKFAAVGIPVVHLQHEPDHVRKRQNAYQLLAVHYGWALTQVFGQGKIQYSTVSDDKTQHTDTLEAQRVIILEEDIHIAVDFFGYMAALAPLLDTDTSLLAVSAFNDNGFPERVKDTTRVLRSDFFPGLGWMMNRRLWDDQLAATWPSGYWDDWLREPEQRQGRHVLRPEISRTFHFGAKGGASNNMFGAQLSHIELDHEAVDWTAQAEDLKVRLSAHQFDTTYLALVEAAEPVTDLIQGRSRMWEVDGNVRLEYHGIEEFAILAKQIGLMSDEKAGVPRTAYKGVVETRLDGQHLLFLTPPLTEVQQSFQ